eukprot:PhM_4_TR2041/c1_g1_i3/m.95446
MDNPNASFDETVINEDKELFLRYVSTKINLEEAQRVLYDAGDNALDYLEYTNRRGETALYVAVDRGHLDAVKLLLDFRANVDVVTKSKMTPLRRARKLGNAEMLWTLYAGLFTAKVDTHGMMDLRSFQTMETVDIEPLCKFLQLQSTVHTLLLHNLNCVAPSEVRNVVLQITSCPHLRYVDFGSGNICASELYVLLSQLLQPNIAPKAKVVDDTQTDEQNDLSADTEQESEGSTSEDESGAESHEEDEILQNDDENHFQKTWGIACRRKPNTWWKRAIDTERHTRYLSSAGAQKFTRFELEGVNLRRKYFLYVAACPLHYLLAPPGDHTRTDVRDGALVRGPTSYLTLAKKVIALMNRQDRPSALTALGSLVDDKGRTPLRLAVDFSLKDIVASILGNTVETGILSVPVQIHDRDGHFSYNYMHDYWDSKSIAVDGLTPLHAAIIDHTAQEVKEGSVGMQTAPEQSSCPPTHIRQLSSSVEGPCTDKALIARMLLRSAVVERPVKLNGHIVQSKEPITLPIPTPDELSDAIDSASLAPLSPFLSTHHRRRRIRATTVLDRVGVMKACCGRSLPVLVLQYAPQLLGDVMELQMHTAADIVATGGSRADGAAPEVSLRMKRLWATFGGRVEMLTDRGLTILHWAAVRRSTALLEELLNTPGADMCATTATLQWTPLHYAVYAGHTDVVHTMLRYAKTKCGDRFLRTVVDYNRNPDKLSPLHLASSFGHTDIVEELVVTGASCVTVKQGEGYDAHDLSIIMLKKQEANPCPPQGNKVEWKSVVSIAKKQIQYFNEQPSIQSKLSDIARAHFLSRAIVYLVFTVLLTVVAEQLTRTPSRVWDEGSDIAVSFREVHDEDSVGRFLRNNLSGYLSAIAPTSSHTRYVRVSTGGTDLKLHIQDLASFTFENFTSVSPTVRVSYSYVTEGVHVFVAMLFRLDTFHAPHIDFSFSRHRDYTSSSDILEVFLQFVLLIFVVSLFKEEVNDIAAACRMAHNLHIEEIEAERLRRRERLQKTWRRCRSLILSLCRMHRPGSEVSRFQELVTETQKKNTPTMRRNAFIFRSPNQVAQKNFNVRSVVANKVTVWVETVLHWTRLPERWRRAKFHGNVLLAGLVEYLGKEWNSVDLMCISLWSYLLVLRLMYLWVVVSSQPDAVEATVASLSSQETALIAVLVVLTWIKVLKYVQVLPHLGPVVTAIVSTITDGKIGIFMLVFMEVLCSFVVGFFVVFRGDLEDYGSPAQALVTVFRMVFGEWNFEALERAHEFLGPLLFVVSVVVANLILLNILIAVVANVYEENLDMCSRTWSWRIVDIYSEALSDGMDFAFSPQEGAVIDIALHHKTYAAGSDLEARLRALLDQQGTTRGLLQQLADLQSSDDSISIERQKINIVQKELHHQLEDVKKKKLELDALMESKMTATEARLREELKTLKQQHKDHMAAQMDQRRELEAVNAEHHAFVVQAEELRRQLRDSHGREVRLREALERAKDVQKLRESEIESLQRQSASRQIQVDDDYKRKKAVLTEYQTELQEYKLNMQRVKELLVASSDVPKKVLPK